MGDGAPEAHRSDALRRDGASAPLRAIVRADLQTFLARLEDEHRGPRLGPGQASEGRRRSIQFAAHDSTSQ